LDFHSVLWTRAGGNVAIDPLPLSAHDERHLRELGGVDTIIVTNSDHLRASVELARASSAKLYVPRLESSRFGGSPVEGVGDGAEPVGGLLVLELAGSKTPGELALLVEGDTLVVGDLVRSHGAGRLDLLPDAKLANREQALASLKRLAALSGIEAVLVGDGWPVFRDGQRAIAELLAKLAS
jgi:hypothetical protein